ncbi:hypothetical protein MK805_14855 [Shimazuella sp. AN120528]|uniref:hypothetical protein n=1 Tax=Shimazuella soli TaxID=1892854 RepID=UPI001F10FA1C|nr:hypothetical protein [Shimazuella soli]MCH5586220.1 hypothetical protein [Shimazuella soli]
MKKVAGIILLAIGSMVLLVHFGRIFLLALMASLAFYGVKKLKHAHTRQEKNVSYLILGIAAICCLFIVPLLFALLISGTLLYFGWKLLDQPSSTSISGATISKHTFDNSFDADWKAFVEKNKHN